MRSRAAARLAATSRLRCVPALRNVHINAAPSSASPTVPLQDLPALPSSDPSPASPSPPDARFETLGAHSSLLSVHLSASQALYTRRGTLVGFGGDPSNALSTLAPLEPIRRAPLAVPWLYQRVTATTPSTLLVAAKSPHTAFAVLDLDGRVDWRIVQRNGLLAWTGHDLKIKPSIEPRFGIAHLGTSTLSGRGLAALVGAGQLYRVRVGAGDTYVAHPSSVLAYSIGRAEPQPFRFKSTSLRLQVPDLGRYLPEIKFVQDMRDTRVYKWTAAALFTLRTWARRTIWGDRLFVRFFGPTTLLLQSRGARIRDVIADHDVNEIADSPAGEVRTAASGQRRPVPEVQLGHRSSIVYADVAADGKLQTNPPSPQS